MNYETRNRTLTYEGVFIHYSCTEKTRLTVILWANIADANFYG